MAHGFFDRGGRPRLDFSASINSIIWETELDQLRNGVMPEDNLAYTPPNRILDPLDLAWYQQEDPSLPPSVRMSEFTPPSVVQRFDRDYGQDSVLPPERERQIVDRLRDTPGMGSDHPSMMGVVWDSVKTIGKAIWEDLSFWAGDIDARERIFRAANFGSLFVPLANVYRFGRAAQMGFRAIEFGGISLALDLLRGDENAASNALWSAAFGGVGQGLATHLGRAWRVNKLKLSKAKWADGMADPKFMAASDGPLMTDNYAIFRMSDISHGFLNRQRGIDIIQKRLADRGLEAFPMHMEVPGQRSLAEGIIIPGMGSREAEKFAKAFGAPRYMTQNHLIDRVLGKMVNVDRTSVRVGSQVSSDTPRMLMFTHPAGKAIRPNLTEDFMDKAQRYTRAALGQGNETVEDVIRAFGGVEGENSYLGETIQWSFGIDPESMTKRAVPDADGVMRTLTDLEQMLEPDGRDSFWSDFSQGFLEFADDPALSIEQKLSLSTRLKHAYQMGVRSMFGVELFELTAVDAAGRPLVERGSMLTRIAEGAHDFMRVPSKMVQAFAGWKSRADHDAMGPFLTDMRDASASLLGKNGNPIRGLQAIFNDVGNGRWHNWKLYGMARRLLADWKAGAHIGSVELDLDLLEGLAEVGAGKRAAIILPTKGFSGLVDVTMETARATHGVEDGARIAFGVDINEAWENLLSKLRRSGLSDEHIMTMTSQQGPLAPIMAQLDESGRLLSDALENPAVAGLGQSAETLGVYEALQKIFGHTFNMEGKVSRRQTRELGMLSRRQRRYAERRNQLLQQAQDRAAEEQKIIEALKLADPEAKQYYVTPNGELRFNLPATLTGGGGISDAVKALVQRFNKLHAERAQAQINLKDLTVGRQFEMPFKPGTKGERFTASELEELIDEFDEVDGGELSDLFDEVQEWREAFMKNRLLSTGIISRDTYDKVITSEEYIPMRRALEEVIRDTRIDDDLVLLNPSNPLKKRTAEKASTVMSWPEQLQKEAILFNRIAHQQQIANVMGDFVDQAEKNVYTKLKEVASRTISNPEIQKALEKGASIAEIKEMLKSIDDVVTRSEFDQVLRDDLGAALDWAEPLHFTKDVNRQLADPEIEVLEAIKKHLPPSLVNKLQQSSTDALMLLDPQAFMQMDKFFSRLVDGKRQWYRVKDSMLADSLKALAPSQVSTITQMMAWPAAMLRLGVTLSAAFMGRNILRDIMVKGVLEGDLSKFGQGLADYVKGFYHVMRQDDTYWEFMRSGAGRSSFLSLDRASLQKNMLEEMERYGQVKTMGDKAKRMFRKTIRHPIEAMQAISDVTENATRVGHFQRLYKEFLEQNMTPDNAIREAGLRARNVTVDFNLHGSKTNALRLVAAFWNPMLQGYDRLVRGVAEDPGGVARRAGTMVTATSIALYALNRQEEDFFDIPQWERNMYWHLKVNGEWVRMPKPFELGMLFGSLPERMMEFSEGHNKEALDKFLQDWAIDGLLAGSLPIPTAAAPFMEIITDHDFFTGNPVTPASVAEVATSEQTTPGTSQFAHNLSKWGGAGFGLSPIEIDKLIRGYFGGLGTSATNVFDFAYNVTKAEVLERTMQAGDYGMTVVERVKDELAGGDIRDVPFFGGFVSRYPRQSENLEEFYRFAERTRIATNTFKRLQDQMRLDDALDFMEGQLGNYALAPQARQLTDQIRQLRDMRNRLGYIPGISGAQKKQQQKILDGLVLKLAGQIGLLKQLEEGISDAS